jgi:hypothetical protein
MEKILQSLEYVINKQCNWVNIESSGISEELVVDNVNKLIVLLKNRRKSVASVHER